MSSFLKKSLIVPGHERVVLAQNVAAREIWQGKAIDFGCLAGELPSFAKASECFRV